MNIRGGKCGSRVVRSDQIFEGKYLQRPGRICGPWLCRIFVEKNWLLSLKSLLYSVRERWSSMAWPGQEGSEYSRKISRMESMMRSNCMLV